MGYGPRQQNDLACAIPKFRENAGDYENRNDETDLEATFAKRSRLPDPSPTDVAAHEKWNQDEKSHPQM